ncbi:hypothetical protein YBT020_23150 [Bacillus thuringiensis serovar finitimus YBT-020]|nr:hypothetical protein YBT020_23150 [Bacillus thuringiensis serovar finitimus YBT-020]
MISTFRQGTSAYQQTTRNRKPSQRMYRDGLLLFIYPLLR